MKFTINNTPHETASTLNITQVLVLAEIKSTLGIAVAVNNSVVPKKDWELVVVKEGDEVVVIKATQGG